MGQEHMTSGDIQRQQCPQKPCSFVRLSRRRVAFFELSASFRLRLRHHFLVAVNAVGDAIFIVFPSTVPVYFVLPAVNEISLPFKRPWIA